MLPPSLFNTSLTFSFSNITGSSDTGSGGITIPESADDVDVMAVVTLSGTDDCSD